MSWNTVPDKELIDTYAAGNSTRAIGQKYGVDRSVVSDRLRRLGVVLRKARVPQVRVVGDDGLRPCGGKCGRRLAAEAFHKNRSRPDGLNSTCRECWAAYIAENMLMRQFGITLATFENLLQAQGGGCAICGEKLGILRNGKRLRLAVDHCHRTGVVRGVLCNPCNLGIGCFKDTPELLEHAIKYLAKGDPHASSL